MFTLSVAIMIVLMMMQSVITSSNQSELTRAERLACIALALLN